MAPYYPTHRVKQKQQEKEYILLLFAAGILFLVPTCLSAFMIPFYYRMVSYYEEQLRSIFIPTTFFFSSTSKPVITESTIIRAATPIVTHAIEIKVKNCKLKLKFLFFS